MKIDTTSAAVTRRLKQTAELRRLCLALAKSSAGLKIQKKYRTNKRIERTARALGR